MDEEEIINEIQDEKPQPIEVTVKKEAPTKEPNFDYDDYTPSDTEILEIEEEIAKKIVKRSKNG